MEVAAEITTMALRGDAHGSVSVMWFPIFVGLLKVNAEFFLLWWTGQVSCGTTEPSSHEGWKRPLISPTQPTVAINHIPQCHISIYIEHLQGWGPPTPRAANASPLFLLFTHCTSFPELKLYSCVWMSIITFLRTVLSGQQMTGVDSALWNTSVLERRNCWMVLYVIQ